MSIFTQPRQDVTPTDVLSQTLSAAMPGLEKGVTALGKGTGINLPSLMLKLGMAKQKERAPLTEQQFTSAYKAAGIDPKQFADEQTYYRAKNAVDKLAQQVGQTAAKQEVFSNLDKYTAEPVSPEEAIPGVEPTAPPEEPGILGKALKRRPPVGRTLGEPGQLGGLVGQAMGFLKGSDAYAKGLGAGVSGKMSAVTSGMPLEDYQKMIQLDDKASVWDKVKYQLGKFTSNYPAFVAGGAGGGAIGGRLGGAPGTMIGGGVGAFALPALLDTSLDGFMKFKAQGWKGSFEDYLKEVDKIAGETALEGIKGGSSAILQAALIPMKAANPAVKKFFEETKFPAIKNMLGKTLITGAGLTEEEALKGGRIVPSKEDIANGFATAFGMNIFEYASERGGKMLEKVRRSANPEDTISRVKQAADALGIDAEKVQAGNKKEEAKLYRVVTDITKSEKGQVEMERIKPKEKMRGEELSKEALEIRRASQKESAETLAARPLEEYLKTKKPYTSPGEKKAMAEATEKLEDVNTEIKTAKSNIEKLDKALESKTLSKDRRNTLKESKAGNEKQLEKLNKLKEDLEYTAKRGRPAFSEEHATALAKRHVEELTFAARNPESQTAQEWNRMFDRDQKYIDAMTEMLKRGVVPEAIYRDYHIKVLEAYNKIYKKALEDVNNAKNVAKGKEKTQLEKISNKLKRNLAINEGKLAKHKEKIQTKEWIKKGPALMRHYLRQLRSDLPSMQKPILEYKQAMEAQEAKVEAAARRAFPPKAVEKTLTSSLEGKSAPKMETVLDESSKQTEGDVKGNKAAYKKWWNEVKGLYKQYKAGEFDVSRLATKITGTYKMLPLKSRLIAGVLINAALKKMGVPGLVRYMFLPVGSRLEKMGIIQIGGMLSRYADNMTNDYHAGQLAKMTLPSERGRKIKELKEKYGTTRANKIIKASRGFKPEKESLMKETWLG